MATMVKLVDAATNETIDHQAIVTDALREASEATDAGIVVGRKVGDVWTLVDAADRHEHDVAVYIA